MSGSSGNIKSNQNKSSNNSNKHLNLNYSPENNGNSNNRYWNFQIPVMLTPWEILRINRLLHEEAGQTLDIHGLSNHPNLNGNQS